MTDDDDAAKGVYLAADLIEALALDHLQRAHELLNQATPAQVSYCVGALLGVIDELAQRFERSPAKRRHLLIHGVRGLREQGAIGAAAEVLLHKRGGEPS